MCFGGREALLLQAVSPFFQPQIADFLFRCGVPHHAGVRGATRFTQKRCIQTFGCYGIWHKEAHQIRLSLFKKQLRNRHGLL